MYKVLIADDEEIIRRGIAHFLKKDPDIQVVAQAEDGEMALEQAMEYHPDLLFVDINMPFLNGLDFIEKLKTVQPDALILVITGYDDFKYAQKALRLGVFDYLLKPIMEDTFYEALGKAKDQLGHRQKQAQYLEWARALVEKNRPALIAEFLEGWLDGRFTEAEIQERISALGLELPEPVGVTLVHLENKDNAEIGGSGTRTCCSMRRKIWRMRSSRRCALYPPAGIPPANWCCSPRGNRALCGRPRGNSSNTCCKPTCRWMSSSPGAWGIRCKACLPHTKGRPRTCVPCWRRRSLSGMQKNTSKKTLPGRNSPSQRRRTIRMSPRST